MFLLDTNICVELFADNPRVVERIEKVSHLRLYTSAIIVGELVYGAMRSNRQIDGLQQVRRLMQRASVLPVSAECAFQYGSLKQQLGAAGQLLEDNDLFIASTAICHGLILVTHDKGFSRIPSLKLDDWLE